jgi:CrcB protein
MIWQLTLVACGGAVGACSRYGVSLLLRLWGLDSWPLATLSVNILGSLGIGIAYVLLDRGAIHGDLRALLVVGFFGAFTTFSTFSLETLHMLESGELGHALAYAIVSLLGCLGGVVAGVGLTRLFI